MDHALDAGAVETAGGKPGAERFLLHIVGEGERREILPFVRIPEVVHHQDVFDAAPVQAPDDGAADQAGASRYDIHGQLLQNLLPRDEPGARIALSARVRIEFWPLCSGPVNPVR